MPLLVQWISLARNALLLDASFQETTPGIMFSYSCFAYSRAFAVSGELMMTLSSLSTTWPLCVHKHQCNQVFASPEAWPNAMPPGVFFFLVAFAYSRNSSVVVGNFWKPAAFIALTR